jgi:hypothetical protein
VAVPVLQRQKTKTSTAGFVQMNFAFALCLFATFATPVAGKIPDCKPHVSLQYPIKPIPPFEPPVQYSSTAREPIDY